MLYRFFLLLDLKADRCHILNHPAFIVSAPLTISSTGLLQLAIRVCSEVVRRLLCTLSVLPMHLYGFLFIRALAANPSALGVDSSSKSVTDDSTNGSSESSSKFPKSNPPSRMSPDSRSTFSAPASCGNPLQRKAATTTVSTPLSEIFQKSSSTDLSSSNTEG